MIEQPQTIEPVSYRIAVRTAIVAAIFSLVVAAVMLYAFFGRSMKDPFSMQDPAQLSARDALKAVLAQQPGNEQIKEELRNLDQQSREDFFRMRALAYSGAALLFGGIVVSLAAAKWAATLRRQHPQPQATAAERDWEASWTPAARWTVGGLFGVFAVTAVTLSLPLRAALPEKPVETSIVTASSVEAPNRVAETRASTTVPKPVSPTPNATKPSASSVPVAVATNTVAPVKAPAAAPAAASLNVPALTDAELARAWPCFRGRGGSGISPYTNVPDDWDGPSHKNIVWTSPVPLTGNSSPIIIADRIFITGADENKRQVFCYDVKAGKLLWTRDVPSNPASNKALSLKDTGAEYPGYAACTMASDGRFVAAIFANGDLAAYDRDGNLAWSQALGVPENPYGHAASLTVYKNLLLVPFDQATPKAARSKLRALDFATGHTVWEQVRPVQSSWTTPIVVRVAGREQLITVACPWIIAYDPPTGKELWRVKSSQGDPAPSPVVSADIVVACINDGAPVLGIRADGSGDVTATRVLWKAEDNTPDICSPLATDEFLFLLNSEGMVTCYDVHKGDKLWEEDLGDFKCKASPSMVGKELFVFGESGKCWILVPSRSGLKRVRQTNLGEGCATSAAFQDGRMYVRGMKNLFCIGQK